MRFSKLLLGASLSLLAAAAQAAWPQKPVRILVGFTPGRSEEHTSESSHT